MIKRPMLAGKAPEDLSELRFPLIASPKIDGIRCVKIGPGEVLTRSLKPIPNLYMRELINAAFPVGVDGEILVGSTFQECTSAVMSHDGESSFTFWLFDYFANGLEIPYEERLQALEGLTLPAFGRVVPTVKVNNLVDLLVLNERFLRDGYEGTMTRDPNGSYKEGRSTTKQQWLLKIKPFEDSEAQIVGFEEMMHNDNEQETNELGLSKRSSKKEGKRAAGTLGKFRVRDIHRRFENEFAIGTGEGLTQALRQEIWNNREIFVGKIVKYKFQAIGTKDAPRLPIFLGFRYPEDM